MPSVSTERQRETDVPSGAWLPRKPWTRDRSPPELKTQSPPFSSCAREGGILRLKGRAPLPVGQEHLGSIWRRSEARGPKQGAKPLHGSGGGRVGARSPGAQL